MNHKFYIFLLAFAFIVLFGNSRQALACSCSIERPVCEAFGSSEAVFVGKVTGSKQQITTSYEGVEEVQDVGEIYFQVEEAFSGVKKGTRVTIHSGTGGGDCGYWFKRGETYLVYGYGDSEKGFGTGICTRTRKVSDAGEDLEFLRNLPRENSGGRIYGKVVEAVKNPNEEGWRQFNPLIGINLTITNTKNPKIIFKAESDAQGYYEAAAIPAGKYKVVPKLPKNAVVSEYSSQEFEIKDRGCAEQSFTVENNSFIKGKIVDAEGKPVKGVWVEMLPEKQETKSRGLGDDTSITDETGEFEFENIPVGNYLLAVNYTNSPNADAPFPATFYPYALNKSEAVPIQIGRGQKIANVVFKLPPRLVEKKVYGSVFWEDGSPASEIEIHLEDTERLGWCVNGCSSETDAQGNFVLSGYLGRNYRIRASGEKVINGEKTKLFPKLITFKADDELPNFKLILNLRKDPAEQEDKK